MLTLKQLRGPGFGPIDAQVMESGCLAVMGASGSGKTRLLRGIADLDPVSGDCLLNDISREKIPATVWRRRVGYVPAEPGWWAPTATEHFSDVSACEELAKLLGVNSDALARPIEDVSTGERQRLALIRALQFEPEVLLLDEPTGPLDEQTTEQVEHVLNEQMKRGVSIIIVTHERAQAERLAAEVRTISGGVMS